MGQMAHLWIYFLYLQPRMHRIMLVRANDHYTSVVLILLGPEKRCGNSGDTFMWPRVPGKEETAEGSLGTVVPGKWQGSGLTWERSVCSLRWRRYSGTRVLAIEERKKKRVVCRMFRNYVLQAISRMRVSPRIVEHSQWSWTWLSYSSCLLNKED